MTTWWMISLPSPHAGFHENTKIQTWSGENASTNDFKPSNIGYLRWYLFDICLFVCIAGVFYCINMILIAFSTFLSAVVINLTYYIQKKSVPGFLKMVRFLSPITNYAKISYCGHNLHKIWLDREWDWGIKTDEIRIRREHFTMNLEMMWSDNCR